MFHVFLLLGQSNMAGYPEASNADKTENPRIEVLGFDDCAGTGRVEGQWGIAAPPLHASRRRYAPPAEPPRSAPASAQAGSGDRSHGCGGGASFARGLLAASPGDGTTGGGTSSARGGIVGGVGGTGLGAGDDAGHAELSRLVTGSPSSITAVSSASAR
ncbi:sialate O-acetylesterase [Sorangium sp. So ce118]